MIIDRLMSRFDATRVEHRVVDGNPDDVYAAAVGTDLIAVGRRSRAIRVLFAARAAAERVTARIRGSAPEPPPPDEAMRLTDLPAHGEWVGLGQDPPRELAFGVIGRFWAGETVWETIDASEFASFDRPGFARIACNVSVRPYGEGRTLLSYEARTQATDGASRRSFLRYWRVVAPMVGVVMRAALAEMARNAARSSVQA